MAKVNYKLHLENLFWKVGLFNFNTMHFKGPFSLSSAAKAKSFHHSKISEFNLSKTLNTIKYFKMSTLH